MNNFKQLWHHLSKRRRKQLALLLFLMIIASILEVVSLGAVLPFLSVLTEPEQVFQHEYAQPLISALTLREPIQLILPITILFITTVLVAGIVRLLLLYVMTRLSYAIGADLSINIYRRTLYQPYATHVARNSSEVINSIITKTNTVISGILTPILILVSSIFILISIITVLFIINMSVALSASIVFGVLYWLVIRSPETISKIIVKSLLTNPHKCSKHCKKGWEESETF